MKKIISLFLLAPILTVTASTLPFQETFEAPAVTNGTLHGQNGWTVGSGTAVVQTSTVEAGTQALEIQNGAITHDLSSSNKSVWVRFQARITDAPETNPDIIADDANVAFFINTNLNLVVYSNDIQVVLNQQVQTNDWIRLNVYCDYDAQTWNLSLDGTNVAAGLSFHSSNTEISSLLIANNSLSSVYIDDLDITDYEQVADAPDSDNNSLPDWWEQKYYGGITAGTPNDPSDNGTLTQLQTYIAGVRPDITDPFIFQYGTDLAMLWNAQPGRRYIIEWTEDLVSGFTSIATNVYTQPTQAMFTDNSHSELPNGFYRLKAEMVD